MLVVLLICLAVPLVAVESGQIIEGLSLKSSILPYSVNYCVYLPPGYDTSARRYPIVYLLHGYSDSEFAWVQFGEIQEAVDRAIATREISPMIIAMPDGKKTFYVNDYLGKDRYEDMFLQEFIPHIETSYRVRSEQAYRAISGLSMGGYGSLALALRNPDVFGGCAAFSAAVWEGEEIAASRNYPRFFSTIFGPLKDGKLPDSYLNCDPLSIARTAPVDELKKIRLYIDCGDDDFLIGGNCALHLALKKREIPHEFRVRDGAHRWIYWRTGIVAGLKFLSGRFHR